MQLILIYRWTDRQMLQAMTIALWARYGRGIIRSLVKTCCCLFQGINQFNQQPLVQQQVQFDHQQQLDQKPQQQQFEQQQQFQPLQQQLDQQQQLDKPLHKRRSRTKRYG